MFWKVTQQVSKAAKNPEPKSSTVCIHFHLTHLHHQIFGESLLCCFTTLYVRKRGEYLLGKTLVIPPSVATNLATTPSLKTCKTTANETSKSITRTHFRKVFVNCETELHAWHKSFYDQSLVSICPNVKQIPCAMCKCVFRLFQTSGHSMKGHTLM